LAFRPVRFEPELHYEMLGTVYELATPCGWAYVQHVLRHPMMGELIRVLPGLFPDRPHDLATVVATKERFVAFYPIRAAARAGDVEAIGTFDVPAGSRAFPLFRWAIGGEGYANGWEIWDGERVVARAQELSSEQRQYPEVEVWGHPVLVERIASTWSWSDTASAPPWPEPNRASPCHDIGRPRPPEENESPIGQVARHYLYFPSLETTEVAHSKLLRPGVTFDIKQADRDEWLLVVAGDRADADSLEEDAIDVAAQLGGRYDGAEEPLT
jgi:hypothetical protein